MTKPVKEEAKTALKTYRWIILMLAVSFTVSAFFFVSELFSGTANAEPGIVHGILTFILAYMTLGNWYIWFTSRELFTMSRSQKKVFRTNYLFLSIFLFAFTILASTSDNPTGLGIHGSIVAPFVLILALFYFILWMTMMRAKRRKSID